jgi:hypothetical protein
MQGCAEAGVKILMQPADSWQTRIIFNNLLLLT